MANVIGIVIGIIIVILFVSWAIGRISGAVQGHTNCKYCRKKLKFLNGSYAVVCNKCGRLQPWAKSATSG